jgi:hypothetical protein
MTLADRTPGATTETGKRWQQRMVRKIKRTVYRERAMGIEIEKCLKHHFARHRPEDAVTILADLAGVDWLYNPNTGEVRFFEFP